MPYPSLEQYNQAFQLHSKLLIDPELKSGSVATTGLGLPLAISGGFALTYTIKSGVKKYAVRCFHRESKALERRYEAISRKISSLRSPYFLDFQFQPQGIKVEGISYPIVKMAWAKGETLGEFLEVNRHSAQALAKLSASIESLAAYLEKEKIAHGDFQTGNLMVSDGGTTVQLIDYDGMFVDEIKTLGSSELGHVNFQHPQRKSTNPFNHTLDRFSLITLWLALKTLQIEPSIWNKSNSELDAIIFRANDFVDPSSSSILGMLSGIQQLSHHVKNFAAVCASAMEKTPSLDDFIAGRNIPVSLATISMNGDIPSSRLKPGYISAYTVLSALEYSACLQRVGDKVEVIGKIIDVKLNKTRNGKPYIFVNFGDWRGNIFKISIWSEGISALPSKPDASWIGKWISVIGLMEPPYVSGKYKYSHISITVTTIGQMTVLSETDARWRLAGPKNSRQALTSTSNNQEALERIKGKSTTSTPKPMSTNATTVNQAILSKLRASTQTASPARAQTQHIVPNKSSTHYVAPTRTSASQSVSPAQNIPSKTVTSNQQTSKTNVIIKIFKWLSRLLH
ncbi:TPA: serine/threonine protein kinase [Klebsiella oxytoca]|uniref:serine/threonine protein kinase n=1 Tax=Enterobacteriaceae TaxID=543 RepID=UPI00190ED17A|nr:MULTISPECIES: serine/threonine protein kinase [Enterobacteriaceae]EKW2359567.1 serine/threonine protein kinase [Klebsiella oxytoca]EKW2418912.1 serine/threonine protein kinase [Klebsiella oxytoca]ELX8406023.1 serine/threonine protein kinase [Klebsiella oxytoca]MDM4571773.1 serine/threonine protein kinase [Klebsiella oxytoca]MDZ7496980.1 serine/threonine protein kinase [Klebsiella oxytoca]